MCRWQEENARGRREKYSTVLPLREDIFLFECTAPSGRLVMIPLDQLHPWNRAAAAAETSCWGRCNLVRAGH